MNRRRTCHAQVTVGCARGGLFAIAALMLTSCLVDKDEKCGANQMENEVAHVSGCVCVPNSVQNPDGIGCTLCGDNAQVSSDGSACVCNPGFARESATGPCVASQLGAACSATAACVGTYPYCATAGYCTTSGCTTSADCAGGYTCDNSVSPSFCRKPATGQGQTCTVGGNECAAFDAKYCASGGAMAACAVSGCKTAKARCDTGYACCDFTPFGLADICVSSMQLSGGKCPGTGADPVVVP